MFYYNSWFNHSLFFTLALIAALALSDALETLLASPAARRGAVAALGVVCLLVCAGVCVHYRAQFRCVEFSGPSEQAQAQTVLAELRAHPDAPRTKLLLFQTSYAWEAGTGVAVLLERHGFHPLVQSDWDVMFGADLALKQSPAEAMADPRLAPVEPWFLVQDLTDPAGFAAHPLTHGFGLRVGGAELDPNGGLTVAFTGQAPNASKYALFGWTSPDGPAAPFVWSEGASAALIFRAKPIPADASVELVYDGFPLLVPGRRDAQRIGVRWNGQSLGVQSVRAAWSDPR